MILENILRVHITRQHVERLVSRVTYHAGRLLEKVINGSATDYRHYIYAGSELVGIYSRTAAGTNTMRYVLGDHQGSFASVDTGTSPGTDIVNQSFTAYGNRRNGQTWSGAPTSADETAINGISRRGYTGETVLGVSMGLNHLNGRIEDAVTGRFLSPDPLIPDPGNTQSFNRYSYVLNNPLTLIDPSGFTEADTISNNPTSGLEDSLPEVVVTGNRYDRLSDNSGAAAESALNGPAAGGRGEPSAGNRSAYTLPDSIVVGQKPPAVASPACTVCDTLFPDPALFRAPSMRSPFDYASQQRPQSQTPMRAKPCGYVGTRIVWTGGALGAGIGATAGAVANATRVLAGLSAELTEAATLSGFDAIIYGAGAVSGVGEAALLGVAVGAGVGLAVGASIAIVGLLLYEGINGAAQYSSNSSCGP